MENLFERILLFIVVLQVIQTIYKRLLGTRGRQATEPNVQDDTNLDPIFVGEEITDRAQRGQRVLASLAQLEINLDDTRHQLDSIDNPRLLTHLARVRSLTHQAVQTKGYVADALRALTRTPVDRNDTIYRALDQLTDAFRFVPRAREELAFITAMIRQSQQSKVRPYLDCSNRIADDFLAVFRTHLRLEDYPTVTTCVDHGEGLSHPASDALDAPIVQLNADLEDEPEHWVNVIGQCAHWLINNDSTIGLACTAQLGHTGPPWLPRQDGHRIIIDLKSAVHHWSPVLLADVLATAWLGPAVGIALVAHWSNETRNSDVNRAYSSSTGRQFSGHPPHYLRFQLILEQLEKMGFSTMVRRLKNEWDAEFVESDGLTVPTLFESDIIVPWEKVFAHARPVCADMYSRRFDCLNGQKIANHRQLVVTPSHWQIVTKGRLDEQSTAARRPSSPRDHLMAMIVATFDERLDRRLATQSLIHAVLQRRNPNTPGRDTFVHEESLGADIRMDALVMRTIFGPRKGAFYASQMTNHHRLWRPIDLVKPRQHPMPRRSRQIKSS